MRLSNNYALNFFMYLNETQGKPVNYKIVIPARFASSRLPGKPLLEIAGQPMIWHTYQRALETKVGNENIYIATEDQRVYECAKAFGAQAIMTRADHESGTSRLLEVAQALCWSNDTIVVNVQGDEPLLPASEIAQVAQLLVDDRLADIATLAAPICTHTEVIDKNSVKVVLDQHNYAMYFSRAAIPFDRDSALIESQLPDTYLRHIGLYSYRVSALTTYSQTQPTQLEELEKLEQLRALYAGMKIKVATLDKATPQGVDTEADLETVREIFINNE